MWLHARVLAPRPLRFVPLLLALALTAGCSGGKPSAATQTPTATPSLGEPAPSEALAPAPSIEPGDSPRKLLRPGADQEQLGAKVDAGLSRIGLHSMHVVTVDSRTGDRLEFDVDQQQRRCSGTAESEEYPGVRFQFVSTDDGLMLMRTDEGELGRRLDGRWVEWKSQLGERCHLGEHWLALGGRAPWVLKGADRMGQERVAGWRTVHFRKRYSDGRTDIWLAADGDTVRLVKAVWRSEGYVETSTFSEFDTAEPVEPVPPADLVISRTELT